MSKPLLLFALALLLAGCAKQPSSSKAGADAPQIFNVRGVVKNVRPDGLSATIDHDAIPGYMDAMTMPFRVKDAAELKSVSTGDRIEFQFHVTTSESWMDRVTIIGRSSPTNTAAAAVAAGRTNAAVAPARTHPLMDYKFTNQFGQPVSLSDFRGSVLGITFIFTRCPVPEYCPRLTKNFEEASRKLSRLPHTPTNWHLLSFTIDPAFDTPRILKAYAERNNYDPAKWSFLTGASEQVTALVRESGVTVEPDAGLFSHNFRTLIVGTNGQLLSSIPIGGPISDGIVTEMLKGLGMTNAPPSTRQPGP